MIGESIREGTMSKRKSAFVREVQRIDRREPWRKKHSKKEAKPTKDESSPEEQAQPSEEEKQ